MLTSLLEADINEYEQECEEYDRQLAFEMLHPRFTAVKSFFLYTLRGWFHKTFTCRLFGCAIELTGHATPDYGYEDWWCKRGCGEGGRHVYY